MLSAACSKVQNPFNPFGTIRKKFPLCKSTKKARYVRSLENKPHLGAFPEAKKSFVFVFFFCFGIIRKNFLLCKSTKKARYVRSLEKKPQFGAFPEAKKANCRSQLYAQRSKMHSIPLRPSEKSSFCAKAQRKRDMCDP